MIDMQPQTFRKKTKYRVVGFEGVVKSLPNVPISFGLDSDCVSRSNGKVGLTIQLTEDTTVTALFREVGCLEKTLPAPILRMSKYINGSYDFIILETKDKIIVRSR